MPEASTWSHGFLSNLISFRAHTFSDGSNYFVIYLPEGQEPTALHRRDLELVANTEEDQCDD